MKMDCYKKRLILLVLAFAVPLFAQNPIPNAGFENWTNGEPDGWTTSNTPGSFSNVVQVNTANSGVAAVRGQVINFNSIIIPPILASGTSGDGFFPITQRYAALTGFYRFMPIDGDQISVIVSVTDAVGTPIGAGVLIIDQAESNFTPFLVPIMYFGTGDAAFASIVFSILNSSGGAPITGATFRLDDLELNNMTGVERLDDNEIAEGFELKQNYPNPFNPSTTIEFKTTKSEHVKLAIYNPLGQEIETLVNETLAPGSYKSEWQPQDLSGGVYLYRLETANEVQTRKLILLK
ncbi:MAG: T9SS type A sorting domain-containing protein [Calditrichia bacterium]